MLHVCWLKEEVCWAPWLSAAEREQPVGPLEHPGSWSAGSVWVEVPSCSVTGNTFQNRQTRS